MSAAPFEDPPEPLVPAYVDLNGYEFMPLHGERLRRSDFNRDATDAEFRAAINLWWSSWWERPAASLPNNDLSLAQMAGCKSVHKWRKVRTQVMRNWVLCADNRWYHPVLAPLAVSAFEKRKGQSAKGALGAQARWKDHRIKGASDARAMLSTDDRGNGPAIGAGNGNRSKVNNPLTPSAEGALQTPRLPKGWWNSDHGMNEAGKILGIGIARVGELRDEYKRRIEQAIKEREREIRHPQEEPADG